MPSRLSICARAGAAKPVPTIAINPTTTILFGTKRMHILLLPQSRTGTAIMESTAARQVFGGT